MVATRQMSSTEQMTVDEFWVRGGSDTVWSYNNPSTQPREELHMGSGSDEAHAGNGYDEIWMGDNTTTTYDIAYGGAYPDIIEDNQPYDADLLCGNDSTDFLNSQDQDGHDKVYGN